MLKNRVMQCGVREVKRQEVAEQTVKCFWCGEEGHKKWECLRRKERREKEEAVPLCKVWEKVKEHSGARGLPPRGAAMCMERWTTPREVVTFVECKGCDYKRTKTEENWGQGFLGKVQMCNMWCGSCKEAWNWRDKEAEEGRAERVKCGMCKGKDTMVGGYNKTAGELEHLRWQIILFLFHFLLLCNSLKCAGHYDSKGVHRII